MKLKELFESADQFLRTQEEIEAWLKKHKIKNYTINDDLSVDVDGSVMLSTHNVPELLVKFRSIEGDFMAWNCGLTSLQGFPREVSGDVTVNQNKLTSLKGAPREVGGDFLCHHNKLTSLEGAPIEVAGDFFCQDNKLTTLQGAPKEVGGAFWCYFNKLTTLIGLKKEHVGGEILCHGNPVSESDLLATIGRT